MIYGQLSIHLFIKNALTIFLAKLYNIITQKKKKTGQNTLKTGQNTKKRVIIK